MNYQTTMSPLQLNAAPGWYQGGAVAINAAFSTQLTTYQSSTLISPLMDAVTSAIGNVSLRVANSTIDAMRSIGSSTHPVLANSIPEDVLTASPVTGPRPLFATIELRRLGEFYVSDLNKFVQAFAAADGYINVTNKVIESAVNANEYLGPTFTNMDDLVTGALSSINLALDAFGQDLGNLGQAIDPIQPNTIGFPSSVLTQIVRIAGGLTPAIERALDENGVEVDLEIDGTDGAQTVPAQTEKDIFNALTDITGANLQDALEILEVTTPNLDSLADLLNPVKTFPQSFASLTFPSPVGAVLIYNLDGTINSDLDLVFPLVFPDAAFIPSGAEFIPSGAEFIPSGAEFIPSGCDQLAKIIPPDQARANQALQIAFGQLSSIGKITLPELARVLQ
jgi:hypothetical protein